MPTKNVKMENFVTISSSNLKLDLNFEKNQSESAQQQNT
jgi:hypothetical protein